MMQPIVKDEEGALRFVENRIVRVLLDESRKRGFGLNELAVRDFSQADWEQFYQLIGYSLSGYHELSNVSDESAREATEAARKLSPAVEFCRDARCPIHCGVTKEAKT